MKIGLIIERFDPQAGGAERSTAQIAGELARRGHRVTILTGSSPDGLAFADATVLTCPAGRPARWEGLNVGRFVRWSRAQRQALGLDVTLSVTTTVPADIIQPRAGLFVVAERRNVARRSTVAARKLKRFLQWMSLKHHLLCRAERRTLGDPEVQCVVAISSYMRAQIEQEGGFPADRIELIPNAAEMPRLDLAARDEARRVLRESWRIPSDATVYAFVANDARRKGGRPMLLAMAELLKTHPQAILLVAGEMAYFMQALAAKLDIREQVRFIGATRRIAEVYVAADVTVLPTYYDPASKVIIESLMLGTPGITTAYNGSADFVEPAAGESGGVGAACTTRRGRVVHEPDDVIGLARAMAELADPDERARCREACKGLAEALSMTRHVDALEALLKRVASDRPA